MRTILKAESRRTLSRRMTNNGISTGTRQVNTLQELVQQDDEQDKDKKRIYDLLSPDIGIQQLGI